MTRVRRLIPRCLAVLMLLVGGPASAQTGAADGEWRTYGGDLGSTRYAPLDQIDGGNFDDLEVAWRFGTVNLGPFPDFNYQATPLMVDGVLYSTAGSRRNVVALDAATGELRWIYRLDEGERGTNAIRRMSGRGVASPTLEPRQRGRRSAQLRPSECLQGGRRGGFANMPAIRETTGQAAVLAQEDSMTSIPSVARGERGRRQSSM